MRFPVTFSRSKPVNPYKVLGGDTLPAQFVKPTPGASQTGSTGYDNIFTSRMISQNGWPLERIVVHALYTGSTTIPAAMNLSLYVYDDNIGYWIALPGSATSIVPSTPGSVAPAATQPVFFNALALIDLVHNSADLGAVQSGAATFMLIVADPGAGAPNGTYQFIVGGDLATKAF